MKRELERPRRELERADIDDMRHHKLGATSMVDDFTEPLTVEVLRLGAGDEARWRPADHAHDSRHAVASRLAAKGLSSGEVAAALEHEKASTAESTYIHRFDPARHRGADPGGTDGRDGRQGTCGAPQICLRSSS